MVELIGVSETDATAVVALITLRFAAALVTPDDDAVI
jgi:hypothetical protein